MDNIQKQETMPIIKDITNSSDEMTNLLDEITNVIGEITNALDEIKYFPEETPIIPNIEETPIIPNIEETPIIPNIEETLIIPNIEETPIIPNIEETLNITSNAFESSLRKSSPEKTPIILNNNEIITPLLNTGITIGADKMFIDEFGNSLFFNIITSPNVVLVGLITNVNTISIKIPKNVNIFSGAILTTYNVVSIGINAFSGQPLKEIYLPSSLITIKEKAFFSCIYLKKIYIPRNVSIIEQDAFYNCKNLLKVIFDKNINIETIQTSLFRECLSLENIIIPKTVKYINDKAFYMCENIKKIIIPSSVQTIGDTVFGRSGIHCINIPSTVTSFGSYVFLDCNKLKKASINTNIFNSEGVFKGSSIEHIIINKNVKPLSIGKYFFENCYNLEYFTIPPTVTEIKDNAFKNSGLKYISIPPTVSILGNYVFDSCLLLTNFSIENKPSSIINPFGNHNQYKRYYYVLDTKVETFTLYFTSCYGLNDSPYVILTDIYEMDNSSLSSSSSCIEEIKKSFIDKRLPRRF